MTQFPPTIEQQAILRAYRETKANLMVVAYAGCAKTTTLEMLAAIVEPNIPTSMLAFNVTIKKELEKRVPSNIKVMTLNGLGHRAWGQVVSGGLRLEEKKIGTLVTQYLKAEGNNSSDDWAIIKALVSSAMTGGLVPKAWTNARGLIPDEDTEWERLTPEWQVEPSHIDGARKVLDQSIRQSYDGLICFDDQIYMSACFGGAFPGFDLVMVDESQDLSPLNHVMVRKTARKRLIVVGDPKQAIYAFRGADSDSMNKLKKLRDDWIELPLATTFRCPQVAVERARPHAPGFTAFSANAIGTITTLPRMDGTAQTWAWQWSDVSAIADGGTTAILCRNNAPLLAMAFKLIKQRISCVMLGRDIGKGLVALVKKILPLPLIPATDCIQQVRNWMEKEIGIASVNGQESKIQSITDRGDCLLAVLENSDVQNAGELQRAISDLFEQSYAQVTLATAHKAKGLEWDTIVHLDPFRIRGGDGASDQEANIRYVLETRMKKNLILAKLEDFSE